MPRLREVPKDEVHDFGKVIYEMLFGDRDPVAEPGTATGSPGNWWTGFAQSPDAFHHARSGPAGPAGPSSSSASTARRPGTQG